MTLNPSGPHMNLKDWAQFDVSSVPTEVLKQVYTQARIELQRRRDVDSVSRQRVAGTFKFKPAKSFHPSHLKWLDDLMDEDWSTVYPRSGGDACFYVYAHVAPGPVRVQCGGRLALDWCGLPFYIGKGAGQRAWDLNRNEGHGQELRQLKARGIKPEQIVHVIKGGLTEAEALEMEAKFIHFFGTRFQQHRRGLLVNLTVPARP